MTTLVATREELASHVTCLLTNLGDTPHDVAAGLQKMGFTGTPDSAWDDPVGNYLAAFLPHGLIVVVSVEEIRVGVDTYITPTYAVAMFSAGFDAGLYPHLIRSAVTR